MADDKKIIFSMVGVSKAFQANKQVLKDIYLSFFYGAKIGIIGLNGSGKSTLMKIIAGLEKSYQGEVVFSPGYSVGYLAQEPHLDDEKTVKEVVMEGVQSIVDTLAEYEEINNKFGLPEYYEDSEKMDALFARQAELQDMESGQQTGTRHGCVALSARRPAGEEPLGRRASPCGIVPSAVAEAGYSVTGRAYQPFGCGKYRLAGTAFAAI